MKKCSKCLEYKTFDNFYKRENRLCGYTSRCKSCLRQYKNVSLTSNRSRRNHFKKTYNITIAQYDEMLLKQNDCCAICKRHKSEVTVKRKNHLCVDHNHSTGKIRGLLCDKCNRGIGLLCDDIDILKNAIEYLLHD